jgi:hypothetical protein
MMTEINWYVELIGLSAIVATLISLRLKDVPARWITALAASAWVAYGLLHNSPATAAMNIILIGIQMFILSKYYLSTNKYIKSDASEISPDPEKL